MRAFVVDAFTDVAFRGNPAGVVFLDGVRGDAWMQSLAAELRHSETAFVTPGPTEITTCVGSRRPLRSTSAGTRRWQLPTPWPRTAPRAPMPSTREAACSAPR